MRSRFECPRCGAGIKPDDVQCGRCGARLKEEPAEEEATPYTTLSTTMDGVIRNFDTKIDMKKAESPRVDRVMKRLEKKRRRLDSREKELKEREQRLQTSLSQMESDAQALEKSVQDIEKRQESLQERETILQENEERLATLAQRLEEWEQLLEQHGSLDDQKLSRRLDKLHQLQTELQESLSENRKIIDEESEETRQAVSGVEEERTMEESEVFEEEVQKIFDELDTQIGAGFQGETAGEKISTHIDQFDQTLDGGIPAGHVVLINGPAGAMKSSLAYYILHHSAVSNGRSSLYISLEQREQSLVSQMEKLDMAREESEADLRVVDMQDLRKMEGLEGDWRTLLREYVKEALQKEDIEMMVLDSLESFKAMTEYEFTRESLNDLFQWFRDLNITVFLISELPTDELVESREGELYLADGAIELSMRQMDEVRVSRWIRCMKMREADIDSRYFALRYSRGSFNLQTPMFR